MMEFIQHNFTEIAAIIALMIGGWYLMILDCENQELKKVNALMYMQCKEINNENMRLKSINSHLKLENPYIKK